MMIIIIVINITLKNENMKIRIIYLSTQVIYHRVFNFMLPTTAPKNKTKQTNKTNKNKQNKQKQNKQTNKQTCPAVITPSVLTDYPSHSKHH